MSASYLSSVLTPERVRLVVPKLIEMINLHTPSDDYDAIALRGLSGALIAPIVAMQLEKNIVAVRKGESSHSQHALEGRSEAGYIIIDDLISSGDTVREILQTMRKYRPASKCRAIYLYHEYQFQFQSYFDDGVPIYCMYLNATTGKLYCWNNNPTINT